MILEQPTGMIVRNQALPLLGHKSVDLRKTPFVRQIIRCEMRRPDIVLRKLILDSASDKTSQRWACTQRTCQRYLQSAQLLPC